MSNLPLNRINSENRLTILTYIILLTFVLLVIGLVFFQVIRSDRYTNLAAQNRLRIIRIQPPRGIIRDAKGTPLALNVRTFTVSGYPVDLQNEEKAKTVISILNKNGIPMTEEELKSLIQKRYSAPYRAITIATNLTFAQAAQLVMEKDFGSLLLLTTVWRRTYPASEYAAHVIGYVSEITKEELEASDADKYRGGDMIGKTGIERTYEDNLRGNPGESVIEVDARGRQLRELSYTYSQPGNDLNLTIDIGAQRYAAELLGNFRGAIVALDITDGSVKCLYSAPSYDPNPLTWGISGKEWAALLDAKERPMMNRAISGAYPPASTFKVVTASAGLKNNVISERTIVNCPGYFELGNRTFRCWRHSGHGGETVVRALRDSCDVYFYEVGRLLGIDKLADTASDFGVGEKTNIDLPSESSGTVAGAKWKKRRIHENWYGGDTVNYSIGQGYVLMTPLQVARMYAAVANGGKLLTPKINSAKETEYRNLELSPEIIKILQEGLLEVGSTGTGRRASAYGVQVAGKTGTAQNSHGDDHAWFAGYAPASNPRYAVVAIAEAGKAGGSVTGPMVGKMLNYLINEKKYRPPAPVEGKNASESAAVPAQQPALQPPAAEPQTQN